MHINTRLVLLLLGALLMPHFAAAQDEEVEMVVLNRTPDVVTVFVWWQSGARIRLGELRGSTTRTFTTPLRDTELWLSLDVLSQRTVGRGDRPESFVAVRPGDRIEWVIRETYPIDLFYRRLTSSSVSGDIESREPRVSRYTTISQLQIQEAQGIEDDSLRAVAYRDALKTINDGLAEENDNPMAFFHLGIVNAGLKDWVAANLAFDEAEALYPDYVDEDGGTGAYRLNAWLDAYNDALLKLDAQDAEGAVELFRAANMVYDRRVEAYLNIGSTLAGLGDFGSGLPGEDIGNVSINHFADGMRPRLGVFEVTALAHIGFSIRRPFLGIGLPIERHCYRGMPFAADLSAVTDVTVL